ncbi:hypothetical protein CFC21_083245 [Triticum aestivum]|uniref:Uncharacterized protein n=3 Tax=Triticum TaxID=4564 RepID=A0A9R1L659_WHEAT|nr:hypothetical protein CFC21_083243 [Triticum aestivum]KAF7078896.1 hypothetical protein CFC21_083245 [Triticum aestivum]VAI45465.1 unnamed protein product [Triticum turgidum subsp. durum]
MPRHLGLHGVIAAGASRHLALHHSGVIAAAVPAAAAFLAVCTLALALCASHSGAGAAATERLRRALASVSRRRTDPVISIHQVQPGGVGADASPPPCVWQKGILMGGKCQLPDFSGVINYDPAGNMVAPGRPRALPALGW